MKTCVGCKHLVRVFGLSLCDAGEKLECVTEQNIYTGRLEFRWINTGTSPGGLLRRTVNERRADGGDCGPERVLYEPGLWQRFRTALGSD